MKPISHWINRIESASQSELEQIESEWKIAGEKYKPKDWYRFWRSFTDRKLVLSGHKLTDPEF